VPLLTRMGLPALKSIQSYRAARWIDKDETSPEAALNRIGQRAFVPILGRSPGLDPSRGVYAIGSCFARGIENALRAHVPVLSIDDAFDDLPLARPDVTGRGFMNKYSTFAIDQELRWALVGGFPEESLVRLADGRWVDPHTNPTLLPGPRATVLARRRTLLEIARQSAEASLVIITLGLVEVWRDLATNTVTTMTPSEEMLETNPKRFQFEVSTFDENYAALESIHATLAANGRPDHQIVVTVSPVPLNATPSGRDVVLANTYSKSLLRVAAEQWAFSHDHVHYFPSYEITVNSADPYRDGRHVRHDLVAHIMTVFRRRFLSGGLGAATPTTRGTVTAVDNA